MIVYYTWHEYNANLLLLTLVKDLRPDGEGWWRVSNGKIFLINKKKAESPR